MGIIESLFLFIGIFVGSYFVMKLSIKKKEELKNKSKNNDNINSANNINNYTNNSNSEQREVEEELQRRKIILVKIDSFLKSAQFLEPIARWREDNVYRYILNGGYLYEFDDFMVETNQRIGIDDEFLCFKQMTYKRVNNPQDFLEKFKLNLKKEKSENDIVSSDNINLA